MSHVTKNKIKMTNMDDIKAAIRQEFPKAIITYRSNDVFTMRTSAADPITFTRNEQTGEVETSGDWWYHSLDLGFDYGNDETAEKFFGRTAAAYGEIQARRHAEEQGFDVQEVIDRVVGGQSQRVIRLTQC